mmetsp:Transcript_45490/g.97486  ORF Transcript_45490/g.97486 Transcript_45490/m.97486 type:complete len:220 (+) Transcript_45490:736-1395(+)
MLPIEELRKLLPSSLWVRVISRINVNPALEPIRLLDEEDGRLISLRSLSWLLDNEQIGMLGVQLDEGLDNGFGSGPLFESALHVICHRLDPIFVQRLQDAHQGRAEAFGPHALKYSRSLRIGRGLDAATLAATASAGGAVPCSPLPVSGSGLASTPLVLHTLPAPPDASRLCSLTTALAAAASGLVEEWVAALGRGWIATVGVHALCCSEVWIQTRMRW